LAEPTPPAAGASFVDPNPAVTRTGLVANPSPGNSELWQIDPMIAFLSADEPKLTFARTLRVVESAVAREAVRRCGRGGDVEPVWMDVRSELLCGLRTAVGTNGRGMAGAHRHSPELDRADHGADLTWTVTSTRYRQRYTQNDLETAAVSHSLNGLPAHRFIRLSKARRGQSPSTYDVERSSKHSQGDLGQGNQFEGANCTDNRADKIA